MRENFCLFLTGISGSGKTTLVNAVAGRMEQNGVKCAILDGDDIRSELGNLFGYTKEERMKNSRVVQLLARKLCENGVNVLAAIVAPYEEMRQQFREYLGESYIEVFVNCSYDECQKRDTKGYYKAVREGRMKNLNGANDDYEIPAYSEIVVNTAIETVEESTEKIVKYLLGDS